MGHPPVPAGSSHPARVFPSRVGGEHAGNGLCHSRSSIPHPCRERGDALGPHPCRRDFVTKRPRVIGEERVCLVTAYKPSAGFSAANAMGRK